MNGIINEVCLQMANIGSKDSAIFQDMAALCRCEEACDVDSEEWRMHQYRIWALWAKARAANQVACRQGLGRAGQEAIGEDEEVSLA